MKNKLMELIIERLSLKDITELEAIIKERLPECREKYTRKDTGELNDICGFLNCVFDGITQEEMKILCIDDRLQKIMPEMHPIIGSKVYKCPKHKDLYTAYGSVQMKRIKNI